MRMFKITETNRYCDEQKEQEKQDKNLYQE